MFNKWDSYNLETEYRRMRASQRVRESSSSSGDNPSANDDQILVQVLDNLYEVNLITRRCAPIYLKFGKKMKVQRCIWYRDGNEPFDERVGDEVEKRHVELVRDGLIVSKEKLAAATAVEMGQMMAAGSDQGDKDSIGSAEAATPETGKGKSKHAERKFERYF